MLLFISYQTSYENKANKIYLEKNYKFIKFYRLCDKCAFCKSFVSTSLLIITTIMTVIFLRLKKHNRAEKIIDVTISKNK